MATAHAPASAPVIPDEIARAAVLPESYKSEQVVYDAYRWLRENMPLAVAQIEGYDPIWLVTKHADIMLIERQADVFHNADLNHILQDKANDEYQKTVLGEGSIRVLDSLTYMDAPEHTKVRGLTRDWFLLPNVRKFEDQIREHADAAVERLMSFDGECDFVRDFALHYPLHVIMTLFGVPEEDEPRMLRLTQDFFGTHDPEEQREGLEQDPVAAAKQWHAAIHDFYDYFQDLAEDRRRNPTDDLLSLIANAELDGEPLSEDYQNGYYVAIAAAGHDTTSSSVAGGMLGMIRFPDQFEKAKSDASLVPGLVDESIRYTSPVKHFMRNTTAPTVVRDQQIGEMERLMLLYSSANRDEDVFDNADAFDITRKPNKHLAFGFGPHVCLGQHVAKLEMRLLFEALLPRLKSVDLAGEPRFAQTNFVGGLKTLPIRFTKA
jgi:cytochrome P450